MNIIQISICNNKNFLRADGDDDKPTKTPKDGDDDKTTKTPKDGDKEIVDTTPKKDQNPEVNTKVTTPSIKSETNKAEETNETPNAPEKQPEIVPKVNEADLQKKLQKKSNLSETKKENTPLPTKTNLKETVDTTKASKGPEQSEDDQLNKKKELKLIPSALVGTKPLTRNHEGKNKRTCDVNGCHQLDSNGNISQTFAYKIKKDKANEKCEIITNPYTENQNDCGLYLYNRDTKNAEYKEEIKNTADVEKVIKKSMESVKPIANTEEALSGKGEPTTEDNLTKKKTVKGSKAVAEQNAPEVIAEKAKKEKIIKKSKQAKKAQAIKVDGIVNKVEENINKKKTDEETTKETDVSSETLPKTADNKPIKNEATPSEENTKAKTE